MAWLATGQLLADRYRLGRQIAVGGMGEVWEAADTRLDRQVAVKVLKPELSGDAEFRTRFHAEARTTASLNSPGIAAVHDYGEVELDTGGGVQEIAYLVMELVAGEPLAAVLARHPRIAADRVLDILEQAGTALEAAHERGLVHRDVKPGNILLTPTGRVKLTDFGIAKAVDAAPVTRQGMVMGTAHYIAPEQAAGQEAGPASDVYSLAVVGYECLAGHRPFLSDNAVTVAMMHIRDTPPPLPPDVPPGARAVIDTTLVKDPRLRYRSGGEFAAAVAAVRAGRRLPIPAGMAAAQAHAAVPTVATAVPGLQQTALLPPGVVTGPHTTSVTGPQTGLAGGPAVPPAGPLPSGPPSGGARPWTPAPPSRRTGRLATRVALGLLAVVAVLVGAVAVSAALDGGDTGGAAVTSGPGPALPPAAAPPVAPAPAPADPATTTQPAPATTTTTTPPAPTEEEPTEVLVDPEDYLGRSGDAAAADLLADGLVPVVIDLQGEPVPDGDAGSCEVTGVEPTGTVGRGSTVLLVCEATP